MFNKIIPQNYYYGSGTEKQYNLGKFFQEFVLQEQYYPYQFDSWTDKAFYGIIDNKKQIVYPRESSLKIYTNNNGAVHKNIIFVTDAFLDLRSYMQDLYKKNIIDPRGSIYSALNVHESTVTAPELYLSYINNLHEAFQNYFFIENRQYKIKNIQTFIPYFIEFIRTTTTITPFNRQEFIASKQVPTNISGLVISLDKGTREDNIEVKSNNFIGNNFFESFVDIAGRFGFYIDKNAPWKLVADLESQAMKGYASRYGLTSTDDIFEKLYHIALSADLLSMKNVIITFWNNYAASRGTNITQDTVRGCDKMFAQVSSLQQITPELFDTYFSINWQLRMYLFIRIHEAKLNITQNKFEIMCEESYRINKYNSTNNALIYINSKVQELASQQAAKHDPLTTPDEVIRMLSRQILAAKKEIINF